MIDMPQEEVGSRILSLAQEGMLDAALRLCDEQLQAPFDRELMKAHCLKVAGHAPLAYKYVAPHTERILASGAPDALLLASQLALINGRSAECVEYLRKAVALPLRVEQHLAQALSTACALGDEALISLIREQLRTLHPHSVHSFLDEARAYLRDGRYSELVRLLSGVVEKAGCAPELKRLWILARHHAAGTPDLERLLAEVRELVPEELEAATLFCATEALARGRPEQVIQVVMATSWSEAQEGQAIGVLLDAVERLLLVSRERAERLGSDLLPRALDHALHYSSRNPADVVRRRHIIRILAPESSGSLLFKYIRLFALADLASWKEVKPVPGWVSSKHVSEEELFARIGVDARKTPVQKLPSGVPCPPDEALDGVLGLLHQASVDVVTADKAPVEIPRLLHLTLSFASRTGRLADGIRARKMAARALCVTGEFQSARDIIETMLLGLSPQDSDPHRRRAWLAFADFSLRALHLREALLGLVCASRCARGEEDEDDFFAELQLWTRMLRDLHLYDEALALVSEARGFLQRSGLEARTAHRLEQLEASIRFMSLGR